MKSIQYTIRNIPGPVDRALRQQAKKRGESFNETVLKALKKATGSTDEPVIYHDLDWLKDTMTRTDKEAFDDAMEWLDALPNNMDS